jgi:cell division protein FtsL
MKNIKKYFSYAIYKIFGSVRNTVFVFLFLGLAISYVVTRMKGIELDYAVYKANKEFNEVNIKNKELKAERASIFSAERLRKISSEYNLSVPKQEQVIVISE